MARHMFVTALIVLVVYTGTLMAIDHPFIASARAEGITALNDTTDKTGLIEHPQTTASPTHHAHNDTQQSTTHLDKVNTNTPVFKGPQIVGLTATVNFENGGHEINRLWKQLLANTALINNIKWNNRNLKAYSYYRDFTSDMTQSRLTIGFDQQDLKFASDKSSVLLPSGHYEQFYVEPNSGIASDAAWVKAYVNKNLIERHKLDHTGNPVSTDALVIIK